jgi:DNA primase
MNQFFVELTNVCHKLLLNSENLMYYLKVRRGVTDRIISTYKLGAFPEDLRKLYKYHNLDPKKLREQNIIWNADHSQFKIYPIVIPICNTSGVPVAIGARTLLSNKKRKRLGVPKYRNSSYKKTSYLFGLDHSIESIRETNKVFVVEGYFDKIMAHQKGIYNVVATCGTIFSERQLIILSRYTNNICLLFDNDEAGKTSASKVMNRFGRTEHINLTYEFTPRGYKDLDEYLRKGGDIKLFTGERTNFDNVEIKTLW